MKLDKLMQTEWGNVANNFHERDKKYSTTELMVPAVVKLHKNDDAAAPAPTAFGGLLRCLDNVPAISQIPHGTSRPGSSHIRLCSVTVQSNKGIAGSAPAAEPNSSPVKESKPDESSRFYPCWNIWKLVTISKSDSDQDMVTAPAPVEEYIRKLYFLTWYLSEMQFVYQFSCVSFVLISVNTLWDMIIRLCMCKGWTHCVKVLEPKSG